MNKSVSNDVHRGVRFAVEAVPRGGGFEGRFTILDVATGHVTGADDTYRPTTDNLWSTPLEALNYATEAAHHVIEGIPAFDKGMPSA
ncbi:hypothetical protein ACG02S_00085 [Roseateles sp. DC23W]|uniref:Uncharacterized protein n=1 Tax=Pelomonas dachongensis TaxID=3299029 RepID=A0ABW7EG60_9BURK